jgi:chemotaxis protein methyltransferase CheR
MTDEECVRLLQWALPQLRLRWAGFRKVRRQVCKRVARRMSELGLADAAAYRRHLAGHAEEWWVLDELCRVTVSRFYRDRRVFDALREVVLPELAREARARGAGALRLWSCGCASGEELYTFSLIWHLELEPGFAALKLDLVGTDTDPVLLARARRACYPESSLRELPASWRERAFALSGEEHCLGERFRRGVDLRLQDAREELPEGSFDLVACRNLVFTYFDPALQREVQSAMLSRLRAGGAFVVGAHETPLGDGLEPWPGFSAPGLYREVPRSTRSMPS